MDTTECLGVEEGGPLETEQLEKAARRHAAGPSEPGQGDYGLFEAQLLSFGLSGVLKTVE